MSLTDDLRETLDLLCRIQPGSFTIDGVDVGREARKARDAHASLLASREAREDGDELQAYREMHHRIDAMLGEHLRVSHEGGYIEAIQNTLESLAAPSTGQREADAEDAARYRWWRDNADANWEVPQVFAPFTLRVELPFWHFTRALPAVSLDRIIDVARGAMTELAADELLHADADALAATEAAAPKPAAETGSTGADHG